MELDIFGRKQSLNFVITGVIQQVILRQFASQYTAVLDEDIKSQKKIRDEFPRKNRLVFHGLLMIFKGRV